MGDDRERSKAKSVGPAVAWLLLASLLALPALSAVRTVCAAAAFLVEFLSEGRLPLLSALTPNPARAPLADRPVPIDLYRPLTLGTPPALVLVHGLAPMGKDDPRLAQAARLLARAGFRVAVPTIPGLTRLRLRPEDAEPVVAAIRSLAGERGSGRVRVLGVSVGAGPALLAAADSRVSDRVGAVLSLGGYASAVELLRYFLTGAYGYGRVSGRVSPQPEAARLFLRENLDLLKSAEDRRAPDAGAPPPRARRSSTWWRTVTPPGWTRSWGTFRPACKTSWPASPPSGRCRGLEPGSSWSTAGGTPRSRSRRA